MVLLLLLLLSSSSRLRDKGIFETIWGYIHTPGLMFTLEDEEVAAERGIVDTNEVVALKRIRLDNEEEGVLYHP